MNIEYSCKNGKVIIKNEKGERKVIEYSDKLDEVLVQENLIEAMEDELAEVDKKIKDNKNRLEKKSKDKFISLIQAIAVTAAIPFASRLMFGDMATMTLILPGTIFSEIFNNISVSAFFTVHGGIINAILYGLFCLTDCSICKELNRELKGLNNEKKTLEENIEIEKQKLKELNESKQTGIEVEPFFDKKVEDKAILEGLKATLQLYYNCGYNEDAYAKYYTNGTLYEKLKSHYTEAGIEEIASYLEENGLVRKRS